MSAVHLSVAHMSAKHRMSSAAAHMSAITGYAERVPGKTKRHVCATAAIQLKNPLQVFSRQPVEIAAAHEAADGVFIRLFI